MAKTADEKSTRAKSATSLLQDQLKDMLKARKKMSTAIEVLSGLKPKQGSVCAGAITELKAQRDLLKKSAAALTERLFDAEE